MKNIIIILATMVLASCSSTYYFQVAEVESDDVQLVDGRYVIEKKISTADWNKESVQIEYNFWNAYGNSGFTIKNNCNDVVTLDLTNSYYILNGYTYDYFSGKDVNVSNSIVTGKSNALGVINAESNNLTSFGISTNVVSSSVTTVNQKEKELIGIPPGAKRILSGYKISDQIYKNCFLRQFNGIGFDVDKRSPEQKFTRENTPIYFENYITYILRGQSYVLTTKFWVVEIKNMSKDEFFKKENQVICGEKTLNKIDVPVEKQANRYFIIYDILEPEIDKVAKKSF